MSEQLLRMSNEGQEQFEVWKLVIKKCLVVLYAI